MCFAQTLIYALAFVAHDCDVHPGLLQHPQAFSLTAVLQVAEVKTSHENPETEIGRLVEELSQSERAVGTGRPGAEPGDGVADLSLTSSSIPPQTRTQGPQVAQKQHLGKIKGKINNTTI